MIVNTKLSRDSKLKGEVSQELIGRSIVILCRLIPDSLLLYSLFVVSLSGRPRIISLLNLLFVLSSFTFAVPVSFLLIQYHFLRSKVQIAQYQMDLQFDRRRSSEGYSYDACVVTGGITRGAQA